MYVYTGSWLCWVREVLLSPAGGGGVSVPRNSFSMLLLSVGWFSTKDSVVELQNMQKTCTGTWTLCCSLVYLVSAVPLLVLW